jgi:hypothetical protein
MLTAPVDLFEEHEPPRFVRGQALPYPDLRRVWTRIQLSEFAGHPELELVILGPDDREEAAMVMVDVQFTYVSLTMHLKHSLAGAAYRLLLRLTRDHWLLDQREISFHLVFVDRDEARAESEQLLWPTRGVPIMRLPSQDDEPALFEDGPLQ